MDGDRNREQRTRRAAVGCIRHLHKAAHTQSAPQRTQRRQADRFDIRKRSGWLVLDDDDIRTHSHDSTVQSKRLA